MSAQPDARLQWLQKQVRALLLDSERLADCLENHRVALPSCATAISKSGLGAFVSATSFQ